MTSRLSVESLSRGATSAPAGAVARTEHSRKRLHTLRLG